MDLARIRSQFPALAHGVAHFDGPGGSLVSTRVAEAVARTMPAMSTNSTVAGSTFAEPKTSASFASRSSGTPTTPTFGSMVANG